MEKVRPPRWTGWPLKVAGDKGYSYPSIRAWLERRVIERVIPQRSHQINRDGKRRLDRGVDRKRARAEQCVGWLKENRRVGTLRQTRHQLHRLPQPRHHQTIPQDVGTG